MNATLLLNQKPFSISRLSLFILLKLFQIKPFFLILSLLCEGKRHFNLSPLAGSNRKKVPCDFYIHTSINVRNHTVFSLKSFCPSAQTQDQDDISLRFASILLSGWVPLLCSHANLFNIMISRVITSCGRFYYFSDCSTVNCMHFLILKMLQVTYLAFFTYKFSLD